MTRYALLLPLLLAATPALATDTPDRGDRI